jgi:hypothetical protein
MARLGPAKSQVLLLRSFHIPGKNHDALLALLELWYPMESDLDLSGNGILKTMGDLKRWP